MKTHLLWDRLLSWWLPPERATGDPARDIDEALRMAYTRPDRKKGNFAQQGGTSVFVVTEESTRVVSVVPPHGRPPPPDWLSWWTKPPAGEEIGRFLDGAVRELAAAPRPHIVARTGRKPLTFDGLRVGEGTVVVVNAPGKAEVFDSVRVARARRALEVFGAVATAKRARKLLADRETAPDTESIDRKLTAMIRRRKVDNDAFFDAVDLLEGMTARELKLAAESS